MQLKLDVFVIKIVEKLRVIKNQGNSRTLKTTCCNLDSLQAALITYHSSGIYIQKQNLVRSNKILHLQEIKLVVKERQ